MTTKQFRAFVLGASFGCVLTFTTLHIPRWAQWVIAVAYVLGIIILDRIIILRNAEGEKENDGSQ